MVDFFTGFFAGGLAILAIMHLVYQKRLTLKGWVSKSDNLSKFWVSTSVYSFFAIAVTLYMVYT